MVLESDNSPLRTVPVFVLTVEAPDQPRRRHAAAELERLGIEAQFVEGYGTADAHIDSLYSPLRNLLMSKRSLSRGEIAVYAGHRAVWQRLIESGAEVALVLEDDFKITDDEALKAVMRDSIPCTDQWDVVKLFDFRPKRIVLRKIFGSTNVVAYKYPASGAVAYLITRNAALKLLRRPRIYRPVDEDISHMWEFGIRVWSVCPNVAAEHSEALGGSKIDEGRSARTETRRMGRSLWGNVLQAVKLARSLAYRRRLGQPGSGRS